MLMKDRVVLVTGASRGIGAATAQLLAAHGAGVVVNYHDVTALVEREEELKRQEQLYETIVNEGELAVENFKNLLRAGGSDYPNTLLNRAGVDLRVQVLDRRLGDDVHEPVERLGRFPGKLGHRLDPGLFQELRVFLAHALDPHQVRTVHPIEDPLGRDARFFSECLPFLWCGRAR